MKCNLTSPINGRFEVHLVTHFKNISSSVKLNKVSKNCDVRIGFSREKTNSMEQALEYFHSQHLYQWFTSHLNVFSRTLVVFSISQ
jgi:hypothetical protein